MAAKLDSYYGLEGSMLLLQIIKSNFRKENQIYVSAGKMKVETAKFHWRMDQRSHDVIYLHE
ncbi:MAG: hypothetical protein M3222_01545 [Thermoproteota archaeon]|nr:hypothetical protein [Thermoproteota archaeon]MDQ3983820.1 hypothetical protein [Thermoproteota archaeon]MDQ4023106.1 hypothetical protein [Thermoproteota archaeon]